MTCRHVGQLQDAFADGGLSSAMLAEVHAHLLQCPACQQQVEMLRACEDVIGKDDNAPSLDHGFADRVLAALPEGPMAGREGILSLETRRQRRWRLMRSVVRSTLPAAAAVLFFSVVIWPPARTQLTQVAGQSVVASDQVVPGEMRQAASIVGKAKQDAEVLGKSVASTFHHAIKRAAKLSESGATVEGLDPESVEPSFLDWFLRPIEQKFTPDVPPAESKDQDSDVVRF